MTGPVRLLIALSGGADSTALLLGMHDLAGHRDHGIEIEAAHFNHRLRGDNSDADEKFCRDLCDRLGVTLHMGSGDVSTHVSADGASLESAARELRYRFLSQTASRHGLDAVVTGHTMDDQAETVLLAITRGAGLRGLSGMSHFTERADLNEDGAGLKVLRPMLALRRSDTEEFCRLAAVSPRQDESNLDPAYARNRVRNNVIPELREINPGVVEAISRLAAVAREDVELIDQIAVGALGIVRIGDGGKISKASLRQISPVLLTHVLAEAFQTAAGTVRDLDMVALRSIVEAVSELDSGSIDLPHGIKLVVEHDAVRFLTGDDDPDCPYPGVVGEHDLGVLRTIKFEDRSSLSARISWPAPDPADLTKWQAIISPEVLRDGRMQVRSRLAGDRFHPLGMVSEMKLQDFFVNQHVPARWRDRVPLVLGEQGICWVVGERVAEWARVPDGASEAVLLEYVGAEG